MSLPQNPFWNLHKRGKIVFLVGLCLIYLFLWTVTILFVPVFELQWTFAMMAVMLTALSFACWQLMGKATLIFIILSILFLGYSRILWLEEAYCWAEGQAIEASGKNLCLPPTEEEKRNSPEITCIAQGYRAHAQCHRDFNLGKLFQ